ncbi:MAG: type II toxin-antitoxin system VapC family toxin [Victivallales bacterium]|nr:type II toxin-antitoxin system VapC family toxin [Victivallales bacterium]
MPDKLLVDTDILVDFLRGNGAAVDFVSNNSTSIMLSSIVVAELYAGVKNDDELATLDRFLSFFRIIPLSQEIARIGAQFKRQYAKSHGLGLADALVAASALTENAELQTLNVKHFPMFTNLKPPYKKN